MGSPLDRAGRAVAGLIGYNPGPGLYSRLERAVEGMPANVRVEEIPGLLKRYKDGVPGWELKAADLDSVIAGRSVVPRDELLSAVRERSPVYTHGEVILGGRPQIQHVPPSSAPDSYYDSDTGEVMRLLNPARPRPDFQFPDTGDVSRIGTGVSHGDPKYSAYGQGGQDYAELLLTQPNLRGDYGSHWDSDTKGVVAHARFDTHGDALRINELQSDLGIHNRKMREQGGVQMTYDAPPQLTTESDADYAARLSGMGFEVQWLDDGSLAVGGRAKSQALPFPLEDAWSDILIKRLALEAARQGHRAIEVASPRAIADKVGGNIDNYEHFYGKVVPGALERLGRKMGGLVEDSVSPGPFSSGYQDSRNAAYHRLGMNDMRANNLLARAGYGDEAARTRGVDIGDASELLGNTAYHHSLRHVPGREHLAGDAPTYMQQVNKDMRANADALFETLSKTRAREVYGNMPYEDALQQSRVEVAQLMPELMRHAEIGSALLHSRSSLTDLHNAQLQRLGQQPSRRYIMSDEMRKRILTQGIGASLLAPVAMEE